MQFKSFADIRLSGDLAVNGFVYIFKFTNDAMTHKFLFLEL